jgi:hypothetical protein
MALNRRHYFVQQGVREKIVIDYASYIMLTTTIDSMWGKQQKKHLKFMNKLARYMINLRFC